VSARRQELAVVGERDTSGALLHRVRTFDFVRRIEDLMPIVGFDEPGDPVAGTYVGEDDAYWLLDRTHRHDKEEKFKKGPPGRLPKLKPAPPGKGPPLVDKKPPKEEKPSTEPKPALEPAGGRIMRLLRVRMGRAIEPGGFVRLTGEKSATPGGLDVEVLETWPRSDARPNIALTTGADGSLVVSCWSDEAHTVAKVVMEPNRLRLRGLWHGPDALALPAFAGVDGVFGVRKKGGVAGKIERKDVAPVPPDGLPIEALGVCF
jgi:hypothetical protein